MTTQKVRPVTSMRRSRPSLSRSEEARGGDTEGHAGKSPSAPALGPPADLGDWRTARLLRDQLCLKDLQPTQLSPASDLGTIAPLFIYIHTKPTHIKQIVS